MTDPQLATIMVNYINRVGHLERIVGIYIYEPDHGGFSQEQIKAEYRQLKSELREVDDHLELAKNSRGRVMYMSAFSPSVREAMAEEFTVSVRML